MLWIEREVGHVAFVFECASAPGGLRTGRVEGISLSQFAFHVSLWPLLGTSLFSVHVQVDLVF